MIRNMRAPTTALLTLCAGLSLACQKTGTDAPVDPKAAAPQEAPAVDPRYQSLPEPTAAPAWAPPSASKKTLKNGLSVWHMKQGSAPLIAIHLVLPSGTAFDPDDKAGLTMLSADLLDEGAGSLSSLELSDKLGRLATDYSSQAGIDYVLLSMNALTENLDESLELLADIVMRPQLSKDEFERRKKHYEATALAARDNPRTAQSRALAHALFGDGYASQPSTGTAKSLKNIQWFDAKNRAREITVPDGAHVVVAGSADEGAVQAAVEKYFGSWKGKRKAGNADLQQAPAGGTAYLVDFPGATQSSLSIAMRAGSSADPNYFAEEVMHQKLGGSFTGRINMNLREDKGYTYGARSSFQRYQEAGYFSVSADVKSETTGASIQEVFKELRDVCGPRPLSEAERNDAVEGMLLGYPLDFDTVASAGYRLASLPLRNRPTDYWTTWPTEIKAISTARANEAARPYCDPKAYSVIIAGDKKSLLPELKALKLKVVELDRDGLPLPAGSEK